MNFQGHILSFGLYFYCHDHRLGEDVALDPRIPLEFT